MLHINGSCHCGYITYSAEVDPEAVTVCHCIDCQVMTGTAFRTTVPATRDNFKLLSGEPAVYIKKTAESGNPRAQAFCPKCGTPIYATSPTDPQVYGLRTGTAMQRSQLAPRKQIWVRSALSWIMGLATMANKAQKQT